jgi:hypothetical protein
VVWLQVHSFTERQADQKEYGLVGQSFITALRQGTIYNLSTIIIISRIFKNNV